MCPTQMNVRRRCLRPSYGRRKVLFICRYYKCRYLSDEFVELEWETHCYDKKQRADGPVLRVGERAQYNDRACIG